MAEDEDVGVVFGAVEVEEGGGGAALEELGDRIEIDGGNSGSCGG